MKQRKPALHVVTLGIPLPLFDHIERLSLNVDKSRSDIMRDAITAGLKTVESVGELIGYIRREETREDARR